MSTDTAAAKRGAFPEKKCSGRTPVGALRLTESSVPPLLLSVPTPELGQRRGTELAEDALEGARHGFCAETAVLLLHGAGKSRIALSRGAVRGEELGTALPCPWVVQEALRSGSSVVAFEPPLSVVCIPLSGVPISAEDGSATSAGTLQSSGACEGALLHLTSSSRRLRPSEAELCLATALGRIAAAVVTGSNALSGRPPATASGSAEGARNARLGADRLVGCSQAIQEVRRLLRLLAGTPLPVLIVGESGTGKELAARALHEESRRAAGPFVSENCAAIPEALFESLLFGHVRGAFTGAERDHEGLFRQAAAGTLFLDEIGELPPSLQAKLLRVLQEGEVRPLGGRSHVPTDARIVTATNRDLSSLLFADRFRKDLYYRLRGAAIELPPLRLRPDDVPPLAEHFLRRAAACRGAALQLSEEALQTLVEYEWPGNVRELSNEIERAAALTDGETIGAGQLSPAVRSHEGVPSAPIAFHPCEKGMIERCLVASRGNVADAAREIGWNRQKLYRRMEKLRVTQGFGRKRA